jgi:hypothetical protein
MMPLPRSCVPRTPGIAATEPRASGSRRWRAWGVRLAAGAAALAALATSCGPGVPRRVSAVSTPGAARPRPLSWAPDPGGRWRWTMVSEEAGTRRVEVETWHLESRGDALAGTLARTVTVLSTDGTPFACNQALVYRQETLFELEGGRDAGGFWLREVAYQTRPSPCDDGQRTRLRYRGRWVHGALALAWDGGSQTLRRLPAAGGQPGGAPGAREDLHGTGVPTSPGWAAAAGSLAGAWRWQGRSVRPDTGEVMIEIEDWALGENAAGQVTGTLTQTVTVFDRDGRVFSCSGDTFYRYRDRYALRGQRRGDAVVLDEVAVEPEAHPCIGGASRHLDAATGAVVGEHVVLTWRGQRRQVLHRP